MKNIILKILDTLENIYYNYIKHNIINLIMIAFLGWIAISIFEIGFLESSSDWNAIVLLLKAREALH